MGLNGPKSLIPVRDDCTFLDLIREQVSRSETLLILMNSFATDIQTQEALHGSRFRKTSKVKTFVQHQVPKLCTEQFSIIRSKVDPAVTWCPPGHGDIYASLITSGTLEELLELGYEYLFVSNSDNLGATLDCRLLGFLIREQKSFLMEVATRTETDRKGGHLAVATDGRFLLREAAQCHPDEQKYFQNISRHQYFNTNNLWINLHLLKDTLNDHLGMLPLPLIVNRKKLEPAIPESQEVFQLETAMGSAITFLPESTAVCVPRSRFAPVKKTSDLLAVRSDAYENTDGAIQLIPERDGRPLLIDLDERFYLTLEDLEKRISATPSLSQCQSLQIIGEFIFSETTALKGSVQLINETNQPVHLDGIYTGSHTFKSSSLK